VVVEQGGGGREGGVPVSLLMLGPVRNGEGGREGGREGERGWKTTASDTYPCFFLTHLPKLPLLPSLPPPLPPSLPPSTERYGCVCPHPSRHRLPLVLSAPRNRRGGGGGGGGRGGGRDRRPGREEQRRERREGVGEEGTEEGE